GTRPGAHGGAGLPSRRAVPGGEEHLSGPRQPVRPADAGDERRLVHRRHRTVPPGRLHRLAHLPLLRDLRADHRLLPGADAHLPRPVLGHLLGRVRAEDAHMIRSFALPDVFYLLEATRWTLLLA